MAAASSRRAICVRRLRDAPSNASGNLNLQSSNRDRLIDRGRRPRLQIEDRKTDDSKSQTDLLELTARAEASHFWFRGFRRFVAPVIADITAGRPGLRLVDCGAGTGHNLSLLR